jgi:hypothetical protein
MIVTPSCDASPIILAEILRISPVQILGADFGSIRGAEVSLYARLRLSKNNLFKEPLSG